MPGIYIHIPFCKKKCAYCDFYSVGYSNFTPDFSNLLIKELALYKSYPEKEVKTVYFGGGTPSLLPPDELKKILDAIFEQMEVNNDAEITLEVNPDDITNLLLKEYRTMGINRLSIGIQSFHDKELQFLGRRHSSLAAREAVKKAQDSGFDNISIDLIYGIPGSSAQSWMESLNSVFELNIQHLSCYHLTYEKGTPLERKLRKGTVSPVIEQVSIDQFRLLTEEAKRHHFIHYEVSNLALPGYIAKHNSSYWNNESYLGLGPSAHSYPDRTYRRYNPENIGLWSEELQKGTLLTNPRYIDKLTLANRFNELLITHLRTINGINLSEIAPQFGEFYRKHLIQSAQKHIDSGYLKVENDSLAIPPEHFIRSDGIILDLMVNPDNT